MQICKHWKQLLVRSQQFQKFWFVNSLTKREVVKIQSLIEPAICIFSSGPSPNAGENTSLVGLQQHTLECTSLSSPGFHLEAARERNKFELKVMLPWIGLKATSSLCSLHNLQAHKFQPLQQFKFQVSWCYVDASCIMRLLTFKTLLREIAHIT